MRFRRKPGLEDGLQNHQKNLLNDPVLETRLVGLEQSLELALRDDFGTGFVIGTPNILVGLLVPRELAMDDGVSER